MPALPGYYTTKEAAEKLGYKDQSSISRFCSTGKIPDAQKIGNAWLVPESWVQEMEKKDINPKGNRGLSREGRK